MVILDHFRIDIKSILVTLGVGTLAIGLALQDTLANMLGGFTIMLDRPFRIGDRIQLSTGEQGDVQEIGIRSTRVLTTDGNMLIIPNSILIKLMMTNHSFPDSRARIMIDVGVAYGADTELAKRLMVEAAEAHAEVMRLPEPVAAFRGFGEFALNLSLICFSSNFRNRLKVVDALNTAINAKFAAAGIAIPYPIRTVRIEGGLKSETADERR
jgi:small-conductance mechanosensitive channel